MTKPAKTKHIEILSITNWLKKRQQFNQQQPPQGRRNSFDALPDSHQRSLDVQFNYTVPGGFYTIPSQRPLTEYLDEIVDRLSKLESSINKEKVSCINKRRNRQTLPRYTPPNLIR